MEKPPKEDLLMRVEPDRVERSFENLETKPLMVPKVSLNAPGVVGKTFPEELLV